MIDVGEGTPPASRPLDLQALVSVPDEEDIAAGLSGTRTSEPTPAEGRKAHSLLRIQLVTEARDHLPATTGTLLKGSWDLLSRVIIKD